MARPRQFDEKQVLRAVRDQFWTAGYAATSLDDLMRVTGLGKGSLYAAFGDKHQLFLRVLRDYVDSGHALLRRKLTEAPHAVDVLHDYLTRPAGEDAQRGCFIANSTSELAAADPDVLAEARRTYEQRTTIIAGGIARAQAQGDLPADTDPQDLAAQVVATQQGIVFMGRTGMDVTQLRATAESLTTRLLGKTPHLDIEASAA
jgi:TetR/AcrR family transcriptional repressor of nem operon